LNLFYAVDLIYHFKRAVTTGAELDFAFVLWGRLPANQETVGRDLGYGQIAGERNWCRTCPESNNRSCKTLATRSLSPCSELIIGVFLELSHLAPFFIALIHNLKPENK